MKNLAPLVVLSVAFVACTVNPIDSNGGDSGAPAGAGTGSAGSGSHRGPTGAAGASGPGTAGATGAAGATTGAAGDASGAAGASATGAAGAHGTGAAGSTSTGAAGTSTTGAAGSSTTGAAGSTSTGGGGTTGAGGGAGKVGTGSAGATGTDGGAVDAGDVCASLIQQYASALTAAKACNVALNSEQCQQEVDTSLSCPGCKTWVHDTKPVDDVRQLWQQAGCDKIHRPCPAIACIAPGKGNCVASSASGPGICTGLTILPAGAQ